MSNQPAPQSTSVLKNPQIILALISGVVTIVAALIGVLPHLLPASATPTPTMTPIVVTATALPTSIPVATNAPLADTQIPEPAQPTLISLAVTTPITAVPNTSSIPSGAPNVKLLFDKASFNLLNQSDYTISLAGVTFRSTSGTWDARKWGPSIYINLPAANCLRLRDSSSNLHTPPAVCANHIYGLIEVGPTAMFWANTDHFDVVHNDQTIATCETSSGECDVYIGLE
ncbi:MAG: hypothetical protein GC179_07185 [Anaerolineaceae bacterium]|nr:hypothetical protein [Anaerolineaceae bacterium]